MIGETVEFIGKTPEGYSERMTGVIMDKVLFLNEESNQIFDHYLIRIIYNDIYYNDVKIVSPSLILYIRK